MRHSLFVGPLRNDAGAAPCGGLSSELEQTSEEVRRRRGNGRARTRCSLRPQQAVPQVSGATV
eukprot:362907-Chlamydomonas_euryale.AAC.5